MLTIVIPYHNGGATLGRLLDSLPESIPVVVVDDHSDVPLQLQRDNVTVIRPEKRGYFSGAVNAGIEAAQTDVLVLNQDVWLEGHAWLAFVLNAQEGYAIAGDGVMGHPAWPKGYVQGTFMYLSREAINKVGLLNGRDYPLWGATAEWQLRACRAGFKALPISPVPGLQHERKQGEQFGSAISRLLHQEPEKQEWFIRTPPALSVIVACHNYARYLPDTIHSLIGGPTCLGDFEPQTFQSFEIIIVDDASTDETPEVGQAFADDWKAIRYIRSERNIGTPNAYNLGIQHAFGKYITLLSADDMRESWSLEELYRHQVENPHSMVYDDFMIFAGGQRTKGWKMPNYHFDTLLEKNQAHSAIMFPKAAWKEVGGYASIMTKGREDWAFNIALGIKGYCGIHVDKPGYLYRREEQGKSYGNTTPEWREFFLGQLMGLFPDVYKGVRPMGCCGGRGPSTVSRNGGNGMARSLSGVPSEGMTLIQYSGKSILRASYYGLVTKTRYQFGKTRALGYVDNRDVEGFLNFKEDGSKVFSLAQTKGVAPEATKQANAKAETSQGEDGQLVVVSADTSDLSAEATITSGPEAVAIVTDPGDMTVAELKLYAEDKTPEQLAALLDAEKAGKARVGAISLLTEALYEGENGD